MAPKKLNFRSCFGVPRSCFGVSRSCFGVSRSCFGVSRSCFGVRGSGKLLSHKRLSHRSDAIYPSYPTYPIYPKGRWVVAGGCADAAPPLKNNHPELAHNGEGASRFAKATLDASDRPRRQVSFILYSSHACARRDGRHGSVIRVWCAVVDMYRAKADRRGAFYQVRSGARRDTPPAPTFGTRETRWGTA